MIPKVIHYCWFGGKPLTPLAKKCIESWKKYCPDYKIVRWDESNFDINNDSPYFKESYERKKWGFTADFPRFWIIYNYGGIYLDTDVELIKPLDSLLYYGSFFGFESVDIDGHTHNIATGLGFGAFKGNDLVKNLMDLYKTIHFVKSDSQIDYTPSPALNRPIFVNYGVKCNGETQIINNNIFLSSEYLCPKTWYNDECNITPNTISIHHFAKSWKVKEPILLRMKKKTKKILLSTRIGRHLLTTKRHK